MNLGIHQSQYIPWPAYFRKIALCDVFVILDDVQYQKNGVQNRNKLRNKKEEFWVTIPIKGALEEKINEKEVADQKWKRKHLQSTIQSYSKAPFWNDYCNEIEGIFTNGSANLNEINLLFIRFILDKLDIKTKVIISSESNFLGSKSELVLNICKSLKANTYLSGTGSKDYLEEDKFKEAGIEIEFMESKNPSYVQFNGDFIPDLSIIDMMMNVDLKSIKEYLNE